MACNGRYPINSITMIEIQKDKIVLLVLTLFRFCNAFWEYSEIAIIVKITTIKIYMY